MAKSISIIFENFLIKKLIIISVYVVIITGCNNRNQVSQAKLRADKLLNDISLGRAYGAFPEKYFPINQTYALMDELKNECDFPNREGVYINEYLQENDYTKKVSFIFEYYLKCDSIRFIITYKLGKEIELFEFNLEPIEKDNFMITRPEKRLKF